MPRPFYRNGWLVWAVATWSAAMVVGFSALAAYKAHAGPHVDAPPQWPIDTRIDRNPNGATLLMFAHPQCPCTQASISELERIVARAPTLPTCRILFVRYPGMAEDWERSTLWNRAASIPGVTVDSDVDGVEARRFRMRTSGHVLLYDLHGQLLFSGGITALRAHEGDSIGKTALLERLSGAASTYSWAEVFGCPLFDSEAGAS